MKGTLEWTSFPSRVTICSHHLGAHFCPGRVDYLGVMSSFTAYKRNVLYRRKDGSRQLHFHAYGCIGFRTFVSHPLASSAGFKPLYLNGAERATVVDKTSQTTLCHQSLLHGQHQLPNNIDLWAMFKSTRLVGTAVSMGWRHIQGVLLYLHK